MFPWNNLKKRITFIIGSGKNVGKTTFLNLAAKELRCDGPVALVSIGVDGEGRDQIFGTPKPLIPVVAGDLVVTTEAQFLSSQGSFEYLHVFSFKTILGRLVLARALRSDYIEIVGPETNSQLAQILKTISQDFPQLPILVDGAVNRVTQVSSAHRAGVVEVMRVTPSYFQSALQRLKLWSLISQTGSVPAKFSDPFVIEGAVTRDKLKKVPKDCSAVVFEDFSKIFVGAQELKALDCPLYFKELFELQGIVINAEDVEFDHILEALNDETLQDKIFWNPFCV